MIRHGKWKYVYFVRYPDRPELFDLEADPEELRLLNVGGGLGIAACCDVLLATDRAVFGAPIARTLGNCLAPAVVARLQRRLGTDVSKQSFLRICRYSCRGKNGNLHSKFFLFTRAGEARHVVMFGSTNLMGYGAKVQWNDLHTEVNRKALHGFFRRIFNEMKQDRPVAEPFTRASIGALDINVYPRYDKTKERDRMLLNLKRIRCKGASGPSGIRNRTLILINMFGWNGTRGVYLARKIAAHSRNGCVVRVLNSRAGGKVTHILRSNGVQIKSPDFDRNGNGKPDDPFDILRDERAPSDVAMRILSNRKQLRYLPDGRSTGGNLTVKVCYDDLLKGKIVVSNPGRVRSERPKDAVSCDS